MAQQPMHRYNDSLPQVYRERIRGESRLLRRALVSIAKADWGKEDFDTDLSRTHESYELPSERALSALEKGVTRALDLKYELQPNDFSVIATALLRGALTYSLDPGLRSKACRSAVRLLSKRECVLSDGINWRAVVDAIIRDHVESMNGAAFWGREIRDLHCRNLVHLLQYCAYHMPGADDAQVVWNSFIEKIRLVNEDADIAFLSFFLMSYVLPVRGEQWTGWTDEGIRLWQTVENCPMWDAQWVALFAKVAKYQPAVVDWDHVVPLMYKQLTASLHLPLGSIAPHHPSRRHIPRHCYFLVHSDLVSAVAVFTAYSLSPLKPVVRNYFEQVLVLLENYCHPSNSGRWSSSIAGFLGTFTNALMHRVTNERSATKAGVTTRVLSDNFKPAIAPMEHRLGDEYVDEIVCILLPLLKLGINSKSHTMIRQASSSARDLSVIAQHLVIPPMLEFAQEGLLYVQSSHRTSAALKVLAALSPTFLDLDLYPSGAQTLPQTLELILPGIDINDPSKTDGALRVLAAAASQLRRLIDSDVVPGLLSFLDEYVPQVLDRIFTLFSSLEAPPKKNRVGVFPQTAPQVSILVLHVAADNLFASLPRYLVIDAAKRIARQISGSATPNAMKQYAILVRTVASALAFSQSSDGTNPAAEIFLPPLLSQVLDKDKDGKMHFTSLSTDELVWRIRMLAQACRCIGLEVKEYVGQLSAVIRLSFERDERPVYKAGGRLLRGVLEGITSIQVSGEYPFLRPVMLEDGKYERDVKWHVPSADDWRIAVDLIRDFLKLARKMAYGSSTASTKSIEMNRDVLFRTLRLLHALQRGARWVLGGAKPTTFDGLEKYEKAGRLEMPFSVALRAVRRPISAGLFGELDAKSAEIASELWSEIYYVISDIVRAVLNERPDDAILLYRVLEPIELASEPFKRAGSGRMHDSASHHYKSMYKSVLALRKPHGVSTGPGRAMPHFIFRLRVAGLHDTRLAYAARPGSNNLDLVQVISKQVSDFTLNDFPRVRSEARGIFTRTLRVLSLESRRKVVTEFIQVLSDSADAARKAQKEQLSKSLTANSVEAQDEVRVDGRLETNTVALAAAEGLEPNKSEIHYERMIGASHVLRSSVLVPLMMRSVTFYDSCIRALIESILSAERPDAAINTGSLFFRMMQCARPLTLSPVRYVKQDFWTIEEKSVTDSESSDMFWIKRREQLEDLNRYLLGLVQKPSGEETKVENVAVHWRRQSLVASILFFNIREDRPPSYEIVDFFVRGMVSDVVSLRQISSKALALILALHGDRVVSKLSAPCINLPSRDGIPKRPPAGDALRAIDSCVGDKEYVRKLIHTLALDHEAMDGADVHDQQSKTPGGYQSLLGLVSHSDGYALWMLDSGDGWPKSVVPRSRDSIVLPRVRFYESLLLNFGWKAFEAFMKPVREIVEKVTQEKKEIVDGVKDEDVRIIIAEVVTGLCRGLKLESMRTDQEEETIRIVTDWVTKILESLTGPQGVVNGATVIRLINTSTPGMIGEKIAENLFEWLSSSKPIIAPVGSGVAARMQARLLRYVHSFYADLGLGDEHRIKRILDETSGELTRQGGFAHELKAVREEVARFLSLTVFHAERYEPLDVCFGDLIELMHESRIEGSRDSISGEIERLALTDGIGESKENSSENEAKKLRSRLGETLSRLIQLVCYSCHSKSFHPHFVKLLPSHFESLDDQDKSRLSHARMALSLAAQCHFERGTLARIVSVAEQASENSSWKIRGAVIPFLQVLLFTSQFTAGEELLTRMRSIVIKLISDSQIEVRAAGAAAFVPIIRDAPEKSVRSARELFMQVLKETQPPRKRAGQRREAMSPGVIRRRHGAALGLSSMVISSPYSVPSWMPGILVALSNCVNDSPPISTSVKTLFVDFMRTHRDEWQKHKQAFTEEELETVLDLLVSPSYYA